MFCEICDIASNASVEALAARSKDQTGRLDVVIVNSGFSGLVTSSFTEDNPIGWKICMDVNALGTYHAAHHLLPLLLAEDGARAFVTISAFAAWIPKGVIAHAGYCMSKLAQTWLVEMMRTNIKKRDFWRLTYIPGRWIQRYPRRRPRSSRRVRIFRSVGTHLLTHGIAVLTDSAEFGMAIYLANQNTKDSS